MKQYLSTADALFFHRVLIDRYGGASGVRDVGALEAALHRPQTGYYQSIIEEAAALMESLVQNHPFIDGNKRVAFAVVDVFLRINQYRITASSESIFSNMMGPMNAGEFDLTHLTHWLETVVVSSKSGRGC